MLPPEPGLDFQVWGWPEVPLMKNHKAFQEEKFPDTIQNVACIISPCTDLSLSASYLQITLSSGLTCSRAATNLLCSKKKEGIEDWKQYNRALQLWQNICGFDLNNLEQN